MYDFYVLTICFSVESAREKGMRIWLISIRSRHVREIGGKKHKKSKEHTYPPSALRHVPFVFARESIFVTLYSSVSSASSTVSWQSILSGLHTLSRNRPITDWTFGCSIPPGKRKGCNGCAEVPLGISGRQFPSRSGNLRHRFIVSGDTTCSRKFAINPQHGYSLSTKNNVGSESIINS